MTGSRGRRRRIVPLFLAAALAAIFLWYSLRGISWDSAGRIVAEASVPRLLAAGCLSTVALFLRACRWRVLLNADGEVDVPEAFWATAAGYFGNNFLPARAGELVRTVMISARHNLDKAYVLATALAERVADAIALVLISAVVLLLLPQEPGWLIRAARPFAALGALGALAIALLPLLGRRATALANRAPIPHALRPKLADGIEQGLRGLAAFHHHRRLAAFLAFTIVIWMLDGVGTVIGASALHLAMPFPIALLLLAGLGLGSALPSTPGYVGIYQFVAVSVLVPFGFSRTDAIAYILVAQAMNYAVVGAWGLAGFLRYRHLQGLTPSSQA